MTAARDVAVLVGSLRRESFTRKLAKAMPELAPPSFALTIVEIGAMPFYDPDREADVPSAWDAFRRRLRIADAILFFTPEYNRSVPAVLKNAIDVGSRPVGKTVWDGKPGAIVSVSPGALGAFGANHHLRQSLTAVNVQAMALPEAYVGNAERLFDESGRLVVEETRIFLRSFLSTFATFVERHATP